MVWYEATGGLPQACESCGIMITILGRRGGEGLIHHRDHDPTNNDAANLALLCVGCHRRHHLTGVAKSPEHRKRIANALRGRSLAQETCLKLSQAQQRRRDRGDLPPRGARAQFTKER